MKCIKRIYFNIIEKLNNKFYMENVVEDELENIVILLEDEKDIQVKFKDLFEDLELGLNLICCSTPEEYEDKLADEKVRDKLRVIIMDLSNTKREARTNVYKASEFIKEEFENNRVPIFVHSGNLDHYIDLVDKGTVFRKEKTATSTIEICKDIQLMNESNFLDVFRVGGELESKIMQEIHSAFVEQFKGDEIKKIIESIKEVSEDNLQERTKEVFERIGIRAVYENWISTRLVEDNFVEKKFNSVEHYYRRISDYDLWTGDIFNNNEDESLCVVLTPRCNLGHCNINQILLCKLEPIDENTLKQFTKNKKGEEKFRKNITDHLTSEKHRFLPPTPQFSGGFVDFNTMFTINPKDFLKKHTRVISMSDELTNDVVRKFSSYILRGGISETEFEEAYFYIKEPLDSEEGVAAKPSIDKNKTS